MSSYFSPELAIEINELLKRFETKRSAIIPIFHLIQQTKNWISESDVAALISDFNLASTDLNEVLTFYTMFQTKPPQKFRFDICNSISCLLAGSQNTLKSLKVHMEQWEQKTGKKPPFEVNAVECLGVCGQGPVAFINSDRHFKVTPEIALKLVEEYLKNHTQEAN